MKDEEKREVVKVYLLVSNGEFEGEANEQLTLSEDDAYAWHDDKRKGCYLYKNHEVFTLDLTELKKVWIKEFAQNLKDSLSTHYKREIIEDKWSVQAVDEFDIDSILKKDGIKL